MMNIAYDMKFGGQFDEFSTDPCGKLDSLFQVEKVNFVYGYWTPFARTTYKPTIMSQQQQAIYDARTLGTGKMLTLGLQHMFAMFGATVLVPVISPCRPPCFSQVSALSCSTS